MTILTKEERAAMRETLERLPMAEWPKPDMEICLDTIDALEAERDEAQDIIRSCYEILEDAGLSTEDADGCGLPGIVCDMAGALNALSGGLK